MSTRNELRHFIDEPRYVSRLRIGAGLVVAAAFMSVAVMAARAPDTKATPADASTPQLAPSEFDVAAERASPPAGLQGFTGASVDQPLPQFDALDQSSAHG